MCIVVILLMAKRWQLLVSWISYITYYIIIISFTYITQPLIRFVWWHLHVTQYHKFSTKLNNNISGPSFINNRGNNRQIWLALISNRITKCYSIRIHNMDSFHTIIWDWVWACDNSVSTHTVLQFMSLRYIRWLPVHCVIHMV